MQRFSPKRQAVLDCLRATDTHPTAEWIYAELQPQYPNLSLTTVYRNIRQLVDEGQVRSVGFFEGHEHFDGRMDEHAHAYCRKCGRIIDIKQPVISKEELAEISQMTGFVVSDTELCVEGLCKECQSSQTV